MTFSFIIGLWFLCYLLNMMIVRLSVPGGSRGVHSKFTIADRSFLHYSAQCVMTAIFSLYLYHYCSKGAWMMFGKMRALETDMYLDLVDS